MRRIQSRSGSFNGADDFEPATLSASCPDDAEILIEIESMAPLAGEPTPVAGIYLNPVDALQHAEEVRQAAIEALHPDDLAKHP